MATNQPATGNEQENKLATPEPTASERFMNMVTREFGSGVGEIALTDFQKRLAQNYFIALDASLKDAEEKRKKVKIKNDKGLWVIKNELEIVWTHINMERLARDVVSAARVGLDPAQKNHVAMTPFKNSVTNKYDIGFIDGYRGIELKAKKYGLDIPDAVTVELKYKTDVFEAIKKDKDHPTEAYIFKITDSFNRGEIEGGFYYHEYSQTPSKNKLVIFTLEDILKRKPKHAPVEFWGGEKDVWETDENGKNKKTGTEHIDGWHDEMCYKTVYRAAYNDITIDSQKIDDDYLHLKKIERDLAEAQFEDEVKENANTGPVIEAEANVHPDQPKDNPPPTNQPGRTPF